MINVVHYDGCFQGQDVHDGDHNFIISNYIGRKRYDQDVSGISVNCNLDLISFIIQVGTFEDRIAIEDKKENIFVHNDFDNLLDDVGVDSNIVKDYLILKVIIKNIVVGFDMSIIINYHLFGGYGVYLNRN